MEFPFQLLAIDCWNGGLAQVQAYIDDTEATYPVLRQGGYLQSRDEYGIAYDNYIVIDEDGIVRYTSVNEVFTGLGRWNDAAVRAALLANVPTSTSLESNTWSEVKALYSKRTP